MIDPIKTGRPATPIWDRMVTKFRVDESTGCWNWTAARNRNGYGQIRLPRRGMLAHRASYEFHCGPIPDGMRVCHNCDNPPCINPGHLFLGSQAENMADMAAKGRQTRGSINRHAKLTEADVAAIRNVNGWTQRGLADAFGVSQPTISEILSRKHWSHV